MKKRSRILGAAVATVLGAGYFPIAPGTVASLISSAVFFLLLHFGISFNYLLAALFPILIVSYWGCIMGHRMWGKDPSRVTVDEFAGCWIACLFVPENGSIAGIVIAFILFRLFDILKPWPVSKADQMKHPSGILLDDLAAGLIAGVCIQFGYLAYKHLYIIGT